MLPEKPALRQLLLARRAALSPETRMQAASLLPAHAAMIARAAAGEIVSGFWSIRDEIDARPLMNILHGHGVRLALPVVTREGLIFRAWQPGEDLVKAPFGLMEPPEHAPTVAPAVMLVPLLGFDRRGGRIGYGKGYYDGAIGRFRPRLTIGIAFACQEVEEVPLESHDERLFQVVTEAGLIDCSAGSGD